MQHQTLNDLLTTQRQLIEEYSKGNNHGHIEGAITDLQRVNRTDERTAA